MTEPPTCPGGYYFKRAVKAPSREKNGNMELAPPKTHIQCSLWVKRASGLILAGVGRAVRVAAASWGGFISYKVNARKLM